MIPDSVYSVTPCMFWYGEKEALEITRHLFKKEHITDKKCDSIGQGWHGLNQVVLTVV